MNVVRMGKCPNCQKSFKVSDPKLVPFCTERCQQIDLGKWLTEAHVISSPLQEEDLQKLMDTDEQE